MFAIDRKAYYEEDIAEWRRVDILIEWFAHWHAINGERCLLHYRKRFPMPSVSSRLLWEQPFQTLILDTCFPKEHVWIRRSNSFHRCHTKWFSLFTALPICLAPPHWSIGRYSHYFGIRWIPPHIYSLVLDLLSI